MPFADDASTGMLVVLGVAAVITLLVVLGVIGSKVARKRRAELLAHASTLGWEPTTDFTQLPPAIAAVARSNRSQLFLRHRTSPMWISWHRWTESSSSYNSSSGRWESSSTTHDLTRYFAALPGYFADMTVERRTKIGAFFKPRRGVGTGDDAFDRMFVVKPADDIAVIRQVNARLMGALAAGAVGPFRIDGNIASLADNSWLRREDLRRRTDELRRLASLLTQG
jgi:hypothetical protein